MNLQKLDDVVSHIDYLIQELKHVRNKLTIEDGVHFYVLYENDTIIIEKFDTEFVEPRIVSYLQDKGPSTAIKECETALNGLGYRALTKNIFWHSDIEWEKLPVGFQALDKVYNIQKMDLDDETRAEVKDRINALYNVQGQLEVQTDN